MSQLTRIEIDLSDEESAEVRAALESGDEAAVAKLMERLTARESLRAQAKELRVRLLTDVVRCSTYMLKQGETEAAERLLSATCALLDGQPLSLEVLESLFTMLNENRIERAKADYGGSA